ncbi:MAG TPA: molybdopterin-dependent oxidoreductase [Candidatus Krumholzibacteria bacterium]|nr:molybdopterin-dependent oxidoreductase [Candidatus Krumholzibacteria bacterium]
MKSDDRILHVRGESVFVDDLPAPAGCLEAAVLGSPVAHGRIVRLDVTQALAVEGVAAVLTAADIPGENQTGTIILDEPALADGAVHCVGQPVAVVLADSATVARRARKLIELEIEALPAVLDPREAAALGHHIIPPRTFACGDVDGAWAACAHVVSGRADSGGQEHFYLETQAALAVPAENGTLLVHSATQAPTAVQRVVARVLGLPMHAVQVDVRRLGGGFGGKEEQATPWAVLAALGAQATGRPVRLVLDRADDMVMTGKRHPYASDWTLGLDADGRVLAWEVVYYQDAGATADLSTAILERTLFHSTGSYFVPHVRATAHCCRTNVFPNTAFRGFGGPQAMFVIETALAAAAHELGVPARDLQRKNLLSEGATFPYGQAAEDCRAARCWDAADRAFGFAALAAAAEAHNRSDDRFARGVAVMPVCFGISFTNTALNQAGALVHVYQDGSVGVSTGAVEMGQGVARKIRRVAARTLGVPEARVHVETANTARVANTSPTAASTGADLNGEAARLACLQVAERLRQVAARELDCAADALTLHDGGIHRDGAPTPLGWDALVNKAYWTRTDLSAHAHYATPRLGFDRASEKGTPFAYHVYGTAVTEVTLDRLLGTYRLDAVRLVHDAAASLDRATDLGQVEGALAQGLGWMLMEELAWSADGRLLTDTAGKYKVPDLDFMPRTLEVRFLEDPNPRAVMGSKAVGEPPFMYGIGAFLALADALRAARPDLPGPTTAPLTPERTLMHLAAPSAPETTP